MRKHGQKFILETISLLNVAIEPGVIERDRGPASQILDQRQVRGTEPPLRGQRQRHGAQDPLPRLQGHAHRGPNLELGRRIFRLAVGRRFFPGFSVGKERLDSLSHLASCFVGEGDRQDMVRLDPLL